MKRRHDPLIQKAEEAFTFLNEATSPGRYFVNIIPFLKYVPDWMPGTTFKKDAYRLRRQLLQMLEDPYEMVLKMMVGFEYKSAPISTYYIICRLMGLKLYRVLLLLNPWRRADKHQIMPCLSNRRPHNCIMVIHQPAYK